MGDQRTNIFGDDDLDLADIKPRAVTRPSPAAARKAAESTGFSSREPKVVPLAVTPAPARSEPAAPAPMPVEVKAEPAPKPAFTRPKRRYRTGRNVQFNMKASPEVITEFIAILDAHGWVLGEGLEKAVEALREKYPKAS